MIFLGLRLSCQPKCLFSIALISCQEGKVPKFPWMLWLMLITVKSIDIKLNTISKSNVAKHYQRPLASTGKAHWMDFSVHQHLLRKPLFVSDLSSLLSGWHLFSLLVFCHICEAFLSFWENEENSAARLLSFNTHLYQKATKTELCTKEEKGTQMMDTHFSGYHPASSGYYNDLLLGVNISYVYL